jgi:hypothetical protein
VRSRVAVLVRTMIYVRNDLRYLELVNPLRHDQIIGIEERSRRLNFMRGAVPLQALRSTMRDIIMEELP